jgi:hypothetical protein
MSFVTTHATDMMKSNWRTNSHNFTSVLSEVQCKRAQYVALNTSNRYSTSYHTWASLTWRTPQRLWFVAPNQTLMVTLHIMCLTLPQRQVTFNWSMGWVKEGWVKKQVRKCTHSVTILVRLPSSGLSPLWMAEEFPTQSLRSAQTQVFM